MTCTGDNNVSQRRRVMLRNRRHRLGLSLTAAAELASVSSTTWSRYEQGHTAAYGQTLERMRRAVQITDDEWDLRTAPETGGASEYAATYTALHPQQGTFTLTIVGTDTPDDAVRALVSGRAKVIGADGAVHTPGPLRLTADAGDANERWAVDLVLTPIT